MHLCMWMFVGVWLYAAVRCAGACSPGALPAGRWSSGPTLVYVCAAAVCCAGACSPGALPAGRWLSGRAHPQTGCTSCWTGKWASTSGPWVRVCVGVGVRVCFCACVCMCGVGGWMLGGQGLLDRPLGIYQRFLGACVRACVLMCEYKSVDRMNSLLNRHMDIPQQPLGACAHTCVCACLRMSVCICCVPACVCLYVFVVCV